MVCLHLPGPSESITLGGVREVSSLGAHDEVMGFVDFAGDILVICQKLLEINSSVLIKEHTSDSWSEFLAEGLLNKSVNAVSDKLGDGLWISVKLLEFVDVNLWQLDFRHLIHLDLLWCSWLLLLHVHLLIWSALHWWVWHASLHLLTHSLLVHLVSSWLIRIMLLIHVLILVVITSTLVVVTTSASVVSLTSSSILVLLCSVIVVPVLLLSTLVIVWSPHLIHWVVISVILSKQ